MARTEPNTGSLVLGGILLGIWIFFMMGFASNGDSEWGIGGLLGLLVAGAMFASRQSTPEVRTIINIGVGLAVGFGLLAVMMSGSFWSWSSGIFAFLLALIGANAIVAGLPRNIEEPNGNSTE